MKNYIILSLLSVFLLSSCANQRNINQFYNKYQGAENSMSFKAPMFLASVMMANNQDYRKFKDKIKSMRVLTLDELNEQESKHVQQDIKEALVRDGFENWFNLNDNGQVINISAQNRGNALKNLVVAVQGDDDLIFINAKTNLTENELTDFITKYIVKEKAEEKDKP